MNILTYIQPSQAAGGVSGHPSRDAVFIRSLMLSAIRLWVRGYRLGGTADDQLAEAFRAVGVVQGRQHFEEFMTAVTAGACRALDVRVPGDHVASDDEVVLLDILRRSQPHLRARCGELPEDFLSHRAIPITALKAQEVAAAFNRAGYTF